MTVRVFHGAKLEVGMELQMITPEGKQKEFSIKWMRDLSDQEINHASEDMVVTLPPLGSACCKALIFSC